MFLALVIVAALAGVAVTLGLIQAWLNEKGDAEYLRDRLLEATDTTERLRVTLEGAELVQNSLMEKVTALVDEVGEREEDVEDLEDALEEVEEELDSADDLLDRADELLPTSTSLFLEQEQELERARTLSHSATALALRLARKMDRLGVEATDEGIAGRSGAVEYPGVGVQRPYREWD